MPRPANIMPSDALKIYVPQDLALKLRLHLYSEAERRVPYGAHSKFINGLIKEYFEKLEASQGVYSRGLE